MYDMSHKRLQWIDVAKGIGIILMVLGHTSIPQMLSNFIWAFHMPLFFLIPQKHQQGSFFGIHQQGCSYNH